MRKLSVSMIVVAIAATGLIELSVSAASGAASPPSPPRSVRPVSGNRRAIVSWTKPLKNHGATVHAYRVIPYLNSGIVAINEFHSAATTQTIFGLKNGKAYTFKVAAKNSAGWSKLSAMSPAITVGVPGVPKNPLETPGDKQVKVEWTAPKTTSGSAVNAYRVAGRVDGVHQPLKVFSSSATSHVISGLTNRKEYAFQVAAHNARGWSSLSELSAGIIVGVPLRPTGVTAVPRPAKAKVSWTPPSSSNGSTITSYRVTPYLGTSARPAVTFASTLTSQVISGLANGSEYRFRVQAHNGRGWSARSMSSREITVGAPIAPTNVTAVPGNGKATVSWTAPAATNGAALGAYKVIPYRAGVAQTPRVFTNTLTTHAITGLTTGKPYRFKVQAHNARGWSPPSASSPVVTPA